MKTRPSTPRAKVALTDPAWEAAKSSCRNVDHDEAVQESLYLQKQFYSMWGHTVAVSPVDVNEVIRTLTQKRIPFVLTGAHAIGGWTGRPRATKDVDILVKGGRNQARAVNALRAVYPQLEVLNFAGVTGFFNPGEKESLLDVTYPHRADQVETLKNAIWTENKEQGLRYRIPSLEEALANKYGAMMTLSRAMEKRTLDSVDFSFMVKHSLDEGRALINLQRLEVLGEMVWPGGGGKEILRLVERVIGGQGIQLDSLG